MTKDIEEIQRYIATLAVQSAPENWNRIELVSRNIWSYAEFSTYFFVEGKENPLRTGINDDDLPDEETASRKFEALRKHMYQVSPGQGAWYTCKMTIEQDGSFNFQFDYDNKPSWKHQPLEEEYANDLKNFPRKSVPLPEWLAPIVSKYGEKYQLKN